MKDLQDAMSLTERVGVLETQVETLKMLLRLSAEGQRQMAKLIEDLGLGLYVHEQRLESLKEESSR